MAECKHRYTVAEFTRWAEYEQLEPFGDQWHMWQMALLLSRVFNYTKSKASRTLKPSDFMPKQPKRKQEPGEMFEKFRQFAHAHNAAMKSKGPK